MHFFSVTWCLVCYTSEENWWINMASHSVPFPYLSLCIDQSTTINVSDNWKVTSYGIKSSVKYVFLPLSHFLVWNVRISTPGRIKKNICNTAVKILNICVIIWLHLLILLNSWLLCNEAKLDILSALEMLRKGPHHLFVYGILCHEWIQENMSQRKTYLKNTEGEIPLPRRSCEFIFSH